MPFPLKVDWEKMAIVLPRVFTDRREINVQGVWRTCIWSVRSLWLHSHLTLLNTRLSKLSSASAKLSRCPLDVSHWEKKMFLSSSTWRFHWVRLMYCQLYRVRYYSWITFYMSQCLYSSKTVVLYNWLWYLVFSALVSVFALWKSLQQNQTQAGSRVILIHFETKGEHRWTHTHAYKHFKPSSLCIVTLHEGHPERRHNIPA